MVKIGNLQVGDFPLLLAPMEDVSDPPFRKICKKNGADVMFTEFVSSEGLIRKAAKSVKKLDIFPYERPIGIQIFGENIEHMKMATAMLTEVTPDLIDINYGCPVKKVACKGAGAGLLQDVRKMQRMTAEIVKMTNVPVTVKTRLGWDEKSIRIVEVAKRLQDVGIAALSIHARTRRQMYKGVADWSYLARVKEDPSIHLPIFGNGDIDSAQKAKQYKEQYGVDGIMIGRASIGYPWIFREIKHYLHTGAQLPPPRLVNRVAVLLEHLDFSIRWKGSRVGVLEMRRHYANYLRGIPHAKECRQALTLATDPEEIKEHLYGLVERQRRDPLHFSEAQSHLLPVDYAEKS